jgi:hypothetical protein
MPQPLSLSDDEMNAVMLAAEPLDPDQRDSFLRALADKLAQETEIGPGTVGRAIRSTQRDFFSPPESHSLGAAPLRTDKLRRAAASPPSE